jgi:phospholipase C
VRQRCPGDIRRFGLAIIALALLVAACSSGHRAASVDRGTRLTSQQRVGIHKIQHVVVIMQENRSFDSYFGTFPGADGIPPGVCAPDPVHNRCVAPYPDHHDVNADGPHDLTAELTDINGGKMNGFIRAASVAAGIRCTDLEDPDCRATRPSGVMAYHTASDIPNYWYYARHYVLQDRMFAPADGASLNQHLYEVSGWSAYCTKHNQPSSCHGSSTMPYLPADVAQRYPSLQKHPIFAWTDLTYLLHKNNVSWGYFVVKGNEPDCEDDAALSCAPVHQDAKTPGIWNPLPEFDTVRDSHQLGNIKSIQAFYRNAKAGTLPAVSWIAPSEAVSEHPPTPVSPGQSFVTSLINAVMRGPNWDSTAIFLAWDDWGGLYDHVVPPRIDDDGYGLRVPALVISAYARRGYIDHQTLSFDAYNKFIEDVFLNGQRLDPATDGRPDPRPTVRENVAGLGNLANDFDFNQPPRRPTLLPVHPHTTLFHTRLRS